MLYYSREERLPRKMSCYDSRQVHLISTEWSDSNEQFL